MFEFFVPVILVFFIAPLSVDGLLYLFGITNDTVIIIADIITIYLAVFCFRGFYNRHVEKKHGNELWYQNRSTHNVIVRGGYDSWLWCSKCGMVEDELDKNVCSGKANE